MNTTTFNFESYNFVMPSSYSLNFTHTPNTTNNDNTTTSTTNINNDYTNNNNDFLVDMQLYPSTIDQQQQQQKQRNVILDQPPLIVPSMATSMDTLSLATNMDTTSMATNTDTVSIATPPQHVDTYSNGSHSSSTESVMTDATSIPIFHQYSKESYEEKNEPCNKRKRQTQKEMRRQVHIQSEQKRRAQIKDGFDTLRQNLPSDCIKKKSSKALILKRTIQYLQQLKNNQIFILSELKRLEEENEKLKQSK